MRFFLISLLIVFTSCSMNKNKVYICGDRECIDKKEIDEYFEKNISLEVLIEKDKDDESINLVKLNLNNENKKNNSKFNKKRKSKITKDKKKLNRKKIKEKLIEKRKIDKIKAKEEEKIAKLKKEKDKQKILKKRKKIKSTNKIKENKTIKETASNKVCLVIKNCDIDEIAEHLEKIGKEKSYPDISKY